MNRLDSIQEQLLQQLNVRSKSLEEIDGLQLFGLNIDAHSSDSKGSVYELLIEKLNAYFKLQRSVKPVSSGSLQQYLTRHCYFSRYVDHTSFKSGYECGLLVGFSEATQHLLLIDQSRRTLRIEDLDSGQIFLGEEASAELTNISPTLLEIYPTFHGEITTVKALFGFILPAIQRDLFGAFALSAILIIFALVSPLITSQVLGDVVPSGDKEWIIATFILSLILAGYKSIFGYLKSIYTARIQNILTIRLEVAITDRVLSYPVPFLESFTTGDLSSRVSAISTIVTSLSSQLLSTSLESLSLIGYGGMMLYLDFELSLILFAYVLVSGIIQSLLIRRQLKLYRKSIPLDASFYDTTLEALNSIAQIRVAGNEPFILNRWYGQLSERLRLDNRAAKLSDWNQAIGSILSTIGLLIIYIFLIVRVLTADNLATAGLSLATFVVFSNAYSGFSGAVFGLISEVDAVFGPLLIDIERALPLLKQKAEVNEFGDQLIQLKGDIKFQNIDFSYPGSSRQLFSSLSFSLLSGRFNAIFGPSGCGKSTILSLILGFYRPCKGSILIDNESLMSLDIDHYRSQIGAVLQQSKLMPGPIRDAISGGLQVNDETIWSVLGKVNMANEVRAMPMGLDTMLSEDCSVISGGQKQRLCIARALLTSPQLLLEDESTSALDVRSQSIVVDNLRSEGITRVVVAHRLATVRCCDHMIVLNSTGQIEAQGTFDECLRESPYLRKVVEQQA